MASDEFVDMYSNEFPDIQPDRIRFLSAIANDTWVEDSAGSEFDALQEVWRSRAIEFVTTSPSPRELFLFVEMYNWDKGHELLKAVAVNPACDLSTALAMFWAASPTYYQEFATREAVPEYNRSGWDFVTKLLPRLMSGVYGPPRSPFDPEDWDADDANQPGSAWHIPPMLCRPIVA